MSHVGASSAQLRPKGRVRRDVRTEKRHLSSDRKPILLADSFPQGFCACCAWLERRTAAPLSRTWCKTYVGMSLSHTRGPFLQFHL